MPATYGGRGPPAKVPVACWRSTKLGPAAVTGISTSPGRGDGTGASVIRRRSCGPVRDVCCRARMVLMAEGFLRLGGGGLPTDTQEDPSRPAKESLPRPRSHPPVEDHPV